MFGDSTLPLKNTDIFRGFAGVAFKQEIEEDSEWVIQNTII